MLQEHGVCKVPRLLTIHLTGDQDHDIAKVIVLNKVLQESNILVILGNRQSGKTWLLNQLTLKSKDVLVCYFYDYMRNANYNFNNFRNLVDPDKKCKKQKGILYLPNDVRVQMLTLESRSIKSGFAPNYVFFEDIELPLQIFLTFKFFTENYSIEHSLKNSLIGINILEDGFKLVEIDESSIV